MADNQPTQSPVIEPIPQTTSKGAGLGDIVVFTGGRKEATRILEFAGLLAEENRARLISVFLQPEPTTTTAQEFALGKGIREVMEVHEKEIDRIEAHQRAVFEDIVHRHGVQSGSEWRSLSHWSSEVAVRAYYADFVVVARPERPGPMPDPPGLAQSLVIEFRAASRPVSTKWHGVSGPARPRSLERNARGHPSRKGCLAPAWARSSCGGLDC
jgi:hypothetical protein